MTKDYVAIAEGYANSVLAGEIPACLHVKNACQRFVNDRQKSESEDWPYTLDEKEANRWCGFLEKLPHVKGRWAAQRQLFILSSWQVFCTVNLFGWRDKKTKLRRFREGYIEVPRKNGKSFWVAGIGNGMLTLDGEYGAEVYCGATTEKQAWEIFRPAKQICDRTPALRKRFGIETSAKSIYCQATYSRFEPVIGNPGDGASPSCGIADEFHEHRNSDLVDTLVTGMGARQQPLMLYVTTAGSDMGGPCYTKRLDVINILKGSADDDRIFGIIFTIDEDDDWDSEDAQIKANPNFGVSVSADFLAGQLCQARRSPTRQASYKTKHLNLWVGAKAAWMNILAFQACRRKRLKIENFRGERCFVALDLASKIDIASMAILFPPGKANKWTAFFRHYLPEAAVLDERSDRYAAWHADGWLTATPGDVIDYEYIEDDLKLIASEHQVIEVPYDPFQATQFSQRMMKEGLPMVEYGATVKNFSEPMKETESKILTKSIQFDMDPVLLWMMGNVVAKLDKKDNIFPDKERPENKIDGPVALFMAMGRALFHDEDEGRSIYEDLDGLDFVDV